MTAPGNDVSGEADAEIRQWCVQYLSRVAKRPPERISHDAEFTSFGLDSAELLFMVSALEDEFGLDLASDTTVEYATVATLARFLTPQLAAKRRGA
jgi:acyl carrier protein